MCTTASINKSTNCNLPGSFIRLLLLVSADLSATTFTAGTGADKFKVTAITGAPDVYEVPFDTKRDAQFTSNKTGRAAYTHNINVRITSGSHPIFRDLQAMQECCGYVALAQRPDGEWYLLGALFQSATDTIVPGELEAIQTDFDTDTRRAGENAGFTVALQSEDMNSLAIPVSAAAAATAIGLIVPAV